MLKVSNATLGVVLAAGLYMASGAPLAAQQAGLVNVNLTLVLNDIANDINVNVSQIPVTVQAPIGVAANVCNVAANVLAHDVNQGGDARCDAQTTSTALNRIVQRSITSQN